MTNDEQIKSITEFSGKVVGELMTLIDQEKQAYGAEHADNIALSVLASYVCTLIYRTFKSADLPKEQQTVEIIGKRYSIMKLAVQNAIAAGFQGAATTYSGMDTEYYCQVKQVPNPVGLPC